MSFTLAINGQNRSFDNLTPPVSLAQVIAAMELKGDRIAVEHNGQIVQRARWADTPVASGDRLEVVHFVGWRLGPKGNSRCGDWPLQDGVEPHAPEPCRSLLQGRSESERARPQAFHRNSGVVAARRRDQHTNVPAQLQSLPGETAMRAQSYLQQMID